MTRPTDWSPLGFYSDPIPGDPSAARAIAGEYSSVAEAITRVAVNLRGLSGCEGMVSDVAATRPAAIAVTTATIVNAAAETATGYKSLTEGIIEAAFAILPFGVGKIAGRLIRRDVTAVRNDTAGAAANALMKSKAG
ncbi:hypothetical protein [Cryobacterium sp. Y50]|uniref:hypothetical protein n=1 Tax=Cryobacterium sp. Y50 TaxID=2048286 RepID=UPI000CE4AE51|nr:hypothetical protein [Cryobacterium sp. Y50]